MQMRTIFILLTLAIHAVSSSAQEIRGTLRVHPDNPRYFTDDDRRAILLVGSHTWANLQDMLVNDVGPFEYDAYLDFLEAHGHNFFRMWVWEQAEGAPWTRDRTQYRPLPYERTGPGLAADGEPKFDLDRWNEAFFDRLRQRVVAAGSRGIFVSIMLFQGWSLDKTESGFGDPLPYHPFAAENNVNGLDVPRTTNDSDEVPTLHSLRVPEILRRQEDYVRKVIDTVNDLDNVLYEIINEGGALDWQEHMIRLVHETEADRGKRHPVGETYRYTPKMLNDDLFASSADWISPANEPGSLFTPGSTPLQDYIEDPPAADGRKVVVSDTDHLWGHGGNYRWAWKSFTRGLNLLFMDPWWPLGGRLDPVKASWMFQGGISKDQRDYPDWELLRQNMGVIRRVSEEIDLAAMVPREDLASTRFCLAAEGEAYVVYLPEGGSVTLDLRGGPGPYAAEWYFPILDRRLAVEWPTFGGDYAVMTAPFTGDAVLILRDASGNR